MKNKKIFCIGFSIFSILIMISQVTAVTVNDYNSNNDIILKQPEKNLFQKLNDDELKIDEDWKSKFFDFLNFLIHDNEFLTEFDFIEDIVSNFISASFNDIERAIEFFELEKTFSIDRIINDIESIRYDHIIEDIQDLLMVEDNTVHFEELYEEKASQAAELVKNDEVDESNYPIISQICKKIGELSRLWIEPLQKIFTIFGLPTGCLITCVLFSPILITFIHYIAWAEFADDYPELIDKPIKNLFKIIPKLYLEKYVKRARKFILQLVLVACVPPDDMEFSEEEPSCSPKDKSINGYKNKEIIFKIDVSDQDKMKYSGVSAYRDHVQLGFDWNNDFEVDYWTPLVNDYIKEKKTITVKKTFSSTGKKVVNVIARDQWGVTSDWSGPIKVNIDSKTKSVTNKYFFIQKVSNFKIFSNLFKELNYFKYILEV